MVGIMPGIMGRIAAGCLGSKGPQLVLVRFEQTTDDRPDYEERNYG